MVKLPKRKKESEKKHFLRTKEEKEREREEIEKTCREKRMKIFTKRRRIAPPRERKGMRLNPFEIFRGKSKVFVSLH